MRSNEMYIVAGGAGSAGRIAGGKVNVPAVCWKIIVVLRRGDHDLSRINADTRVIAVSMPNREREEIGGSKWTNWITTVAQVEKTTGYDLLSALPDDVERALEQKKDAGLVSRAAASGSSSAAGHSSSRAKPAPPTDSEQGNGGKWSLEKVWVNTNSGIYHRAGCRWYGNTQEGAFMSEAAAKVRGNRVARDE